MKNQSTYGVWLRSDSSLGVVALALLLGATSADAADWRIQPRVTIGATYTDNVSLERASLSNDSTILQLSPGLSIQHDGVRVSANLDYNLQGVAYVGNRDTTRVNHQLQFSSGTEVVREHLFLDLAAGVFQALIDNDLPYSRSSLNLVGNQAEVAHFQVSPSYRYQFGSVASFNARYGYNKSFVSRAGFGDQESQDGSVTLASGPAFERVTWSLDYNYRRNDANTIVNGREFESARASVSLAVSDWLRLRGSAGREMNSFASFRPSGTATTWSAGFTWIPSRRTTLSASVGERAFGRNYSLDLNHRRRRVSLALSYSEDYETYLRTIQQTVLVPLVDAFGQPVIDPLRGVEILLPVDIPTLTDDVYLSRRWTMTVGYTRPRDTFSLRAFRTDREYQLSGLSDLGTGITGSWARKITRTLSGNLTASAQRNELSGRVLPDYIVHVSSGLSLQFGRGLTGSLSLRHYRRISDVALRDYVENSVTGTLTYLF